jgi:hypothetical protein
LVWKENQRYVISDIEKYLTVSIKWQNGVKMAFNINDGMLP